MEPGDFLIEDYKQKIGYLTAHFGRMWTRFNFFITLEAALLSGKLLFSCEDSTRPLSVVGIILSLIWYLMGAQDRFLADYYRWQVMQAASRLREALKSLSSASTEELDQNSLREILIPISLEAAEEFVGDVNDDLVKEYHKWRYKQIDNQVSRLLEGVSSWRSKYFSTTHLAAWIPLAAVVLWLLYLRVSP